MTTHASKRLEETSRLRCNETYTLGTVGLKGRSEEGQADVERLGWLNEGFHVDGPCWQVHVIWLQICQRWEGRKRREDGRRAS
jgi:hypothetical protein